MHRSTAVAILLTGLIIYGGLYPFRDWVSGNAVAFLTERSPHSGIEDVFVNLIVFFPLGFATTLALRAHRGWAGSVALSVLHGFSVSVLIEVCQAYLPMRFSSATDLAMNTMGTLLGSTLALAHLARHARAESETKPPLSLLYLSIAAWAAAQSLPLGTVSYPAATMASWSELILAPTLPRSLYLGTIFTTGLGLFALGQLLNACAETGRSLTKPLLLMLPILASVFTRDASQVLEACLGALLGSVALLAHPRQSTRGHAMVALGALLVYLLIWQATPAETGSFRSFNWIPFRPQLRSPLLGIVDLFTCFWLAIAITAGVLILHPRPSLRVVFVLCASSMLGILALEWLQTHLPGRYGDMTTALVMGGAIALSFAFARHTPSSRPPASVPK